MTDFFALLDFPRSPWLDAAEVKARFAERSGTVHPDRVHQADEATRATANQSYAELNSAQQCLADPRKRLRHLLELETGQPPSDVGAVPPQISDLFFTVGRALRSADELVRQKQAATSPMLQAQLMKQALEKTESLRQTIGNLEVRLRAVDDRCRAVADSWEEGNRDPNAVSAIHRDYSYLHRWLEQLREKLLQVSL